MGDTSSLITVFVCIALLIFWRRYRSMYKPIKGTGKRILWPLLFLTPGIIWFFGPVHPAILQVVLASMHWDSFRRTTYNFNKLRTKR